MQCLSLHKRSHWYEYVGVYVAFTVNKWFQFKKEIAQKYHVIGCNKSISFRVIFFKARIKGVILYTRERKLDVRIYAVFVGNVSSLKKICVKG